MATIYHDVLDTVRTSEERKNTDQWGTGIAHLHGKGLMVLYALLGHQQRISQSQAFDSAIVLECCSDEDEEERKAFGELIHRGFFQIPLFNQPSLRHAFRSKLETIELSSWRKADVPEIRELLVKHVDGKSEGKELPDEIKKNLKAVTWLNSVLASAPRQPTAVRAPPEFALSNWIAHNSAIFEKLDKESPVAQGLRELNELQTNDRTNHYTKIREMNLSSDIKEDLRSIVNFGYNRVLSRSLQASQFELTTSQPRAAQALNYLGQPFDAVELVTAEAFPGIEKSSWSSVLRFIDATKKHPPHTRRREAFAARFIARVTAERSGWAVIPKLPRVAIELLQHRGIELLAEFLTGAEGAIPPYLISDLSDAVELKLQLGEKASESARRGMIDHYEHKYRGVLAKLKMIPSTKNQKNIV